MAIRLDGLRKVFQASGLTVEAVREVSAEIADHQFVSIIGPSGCGKSTLLRLISGLLSPTEGAVYIDDEPGGWSRRGTLGSCFRPRRF